MISQVSPFATRVPCAGVTLHFCGALVLNLNAMGLEARFVIVILAVQVAVSLSLTSVLTG